MATYRQKGLFGQIQALRPYRPFQHDILVSWHGISGPRHEGPRVVPNAQKVRSREHFGSFHKCSLVGAFGALTGAAAGFSDPWCRGGPGQGSPGNRATPNNADDTHTTGHMGYPILGHFTDFSGQKWSFSGQKSPKEAQRSPKRGQRGPKRSQRGPRRSQEGPVVAQWLKEAQMIGPGQLPARAASLPVHPSVRNSTLTCLFTKFTGFTRNTELCSRTFS